MAEEHVLYFDVKEDRAYLRDPEGKRAKIRADTLEALVLGGFVHLADTDNSTWLYGLTSRGEKAVE
jgi:hypothetical protein